MSKKILKENTDKEELPRLKRVLRKEWFRTHRVLVNIGYVFLGILILLASILLFFSAASLHPAKEEKVDIEGKASQTLKKNEEISILSWNTGYGVLGDNEDYFLDGGTHVNPDDINRVKENLLDILKKTQYLNPDIILFQEVDTYSKRSFDIDEKEYYTLGLGNTLYQSSSALNFKAVVPYPMPMIGHVEAGIVTYSTFEMSSSTRIQLPVPFSWPLSMFNLKRCLLVSRMKIEGSDKELVVINLHLEAYDDGTGKIEQTKMLAQIMKEEYAKGNYVIAGGDFNQNFDNVGMVYPYTEGLWKPGAIESASFGSDFSLLMDPTNPTCRSLDKAYVGADKDIFQYYMIDGFIVSKNIKVNNIETINYNFKSTDHNPILIKIELN